MIYIYSYVDIGVCNRDADDTLVYYTSLTNMSLQDSMLIYIYSYVDIGVCNRDADDTLVYYTSLTNMSLQDSMQLIYIYIVMSILVCVIEMPMIRPSTIHHLQICHYRIACN